MAAKQQRSSWLDGLAEAKRLRAKGRLDQMVKKSAAAILYPHLPSSSSSDNEEAPAKLSDADRIRELYKPAGSRIKRRSK